MTRPVTTHQTVFSSIYRRDVWGGSGTGSKESSTRAYRLLLQELLNTRRFASVVDLGCGDWEFSKLIDWSAVNYVGVDVIRSLIRRNSRLYGGNGIHFRCVDVLDDDLPEGDLYLVKDVLQHWTGSEIRHFLRRMAGRRLLVTNTVSAVRYRDLASAGGYRSLDIRRAPFRVPAKEVLQYYAGPRDRKVVLFMESVPCLAGAES